jgi:anti-anti-sigma factor
MLATLQIEMHGAAPVARLGGEVDASNAPSLTKQIKEAVPNTALGMVLDLSETTYIDSSGVHLIFDLADAMRRRQQTLQLVVPPDTFVADVIGAVGLTGTAGVYADLHGAVQAVETHEF